MHITRLEVRHWRRHDHLLIDGLSERITLICGPNEAGKSTLAEALRFALFEPCKPVYDARKALQQRGGSEPPEVEVDLEVDGQYWRIAKRFLRRQQTRLSGPAGRTLEGEEAERRLQELIGIAVPDAGRVTRDVDQRHLGLWPVLWLQQGQLAELGDAVTDGVRSRLSELVAREVGAVSAGPLGARALTLVEQEHERYWTGAAMRPTGEHGKALKEREAAQARRDQAQQALRGFETAASDLLQATRRLAELVPRQRRAEEMAQAAQRRARQAEEQLRTLERERATLLTLRRALTDAEQTAARRAGLAEQLDRLRTELTASVAKEAALAAMLDRAEQAHLRREAELAAAQQRTRSAQDDAERAGLAAERATLALRVAERGALQARLADLDAERRQAQTAADALPELTPRTVATLRDLAAAHREACVQRDAAATAVVFQAERPVTVRWLADGHEQAAEIAAGGTFEGRTAGLGELHLAGIGSVRIRTGAGGAADLASAARTAGEALEQALRAAGVSSPDAAQAAIQARQEALGAARAATAALAAALGLEPRADGDALAAAGARLQREAAADRARLDAMPAPAGPAGDPESARTAVQATRMAEQERRSALDESAAELKHLGRERSAAVTAHAVHDERARSTGAELVLLPAPEELARLRADAALRLGEAVNRETGLQAAWEELGGADAASIAEGAARSASHLQEQVHDTLRQRDRLRVELRTASDQDPAAALQEAAAESARAEERAAALERQAAAVRTLRATVIEVQKETRATLAAPVRGAIEPYLRRIFPRADLLLGDDDWRISGWSADAMEEPFEHLSLGAREQFALLVRLGLAEVLAQGRRLPLVLDDPLVNADLQRRAALLKALRHAARTLQIILFTCHEAEHDGLGAEKTVVLTGR